MGANDSRPLHGSLEMSDILLTRGQIEGWEARKREIPVEIARLEVELRSVSSKLEAVRTIFGEDLSFADSNEQVDECDVRPPPKRQAKGDKPTWAFEIIRVLKDAKGPLSYDDLRGEIDKGPLRGEFERSTKGFYNAVSRLQKKSEIAKHSDRLFIFSDLQEYLRKTKSGEIAPLEPLKTHLDRSPMGAEVLALVNEHPLGISGREIIERLREDDRFSGTLRKNQTGAYNVIARLVDRNEIRREDGCLFPFNENGEPAGSPDAEVKEVSGLFDPHMSTQGPARQ